MPMIATLAHRAVLALLLVAAGAGMAQAQTCSPSSVSVTLNAGNYDASSPAYIAPTPTAQFVFTCSATPAGNYFYKLTITGSNPRQMINPATSTPLAYQLCGAVSGNVCTVPWTSTSPITGGAISLPSGNPNAVTINVYALLAPQQSVDGNPSPYMQVNSGIQLFLCRGSPCP